MSSLIPEAILLLLRCTSLKRAYAPLRLHIGIFWRLHNMTHSKVLRPMVAIGDFQSNRSKSERKDWSLADVLELQWRAVTNMWFTMKVRFSTLLLYIEVVNNRTLYIVSNYQKGSDWVNTKNHYFSKYWTFFQEFKQQAFMRNQGKVAMTSLNSHLWKS